MRRSLIITVCCAMAAVICSGCTMTMFPADTTALEGTWDMTMQVNDHSTGLKDTTYAGSVFGNTYVFYHNKDVQSTVLILGITITMNGTWSATADSVTITTYYNSSTSVSKFGYTVSANNLTLSILETEGSGYKIRTEYYAKQ
jgi:hypothetical protein